MAEVPLCPGLVQVCFFHPLASLQVSASEGRLSLCINDCTQATKRKLVSRHAWQKTECLSSACCFPLLDIYFLVHHNSVNKGQEFSQHV